MASPNQIKSATENRGTFDARNADITFSLTGEDYRIAREFNALEQSEPVTVDVPEVYSDDIKEAIAFARERYRKLQRETANEPIKLPDGKLAYVTGRGFREVKQHAAGRRELAALCKLRELCQSAIFINSSENTQRAKETKKRIARFHYYLAKGNFVGAKSFNENKRTLYTDEAYICLAFAEDMDGNVFYDANAANASEIDEIKSTSEELQAGRVTNTGVAGTEAPYRGRIHRIKEFVNYVNAQIDNFSASVMAEGKPGAFDGRNADITLSLRGQASVLDRVSLRELAQEEAVVRLMNRARRGINRWRRVFAGDETGAAAAAQALGEAGSVMEAALQYLPAGKRPHYARQMQLVEAYARVIETGRVRKMNKAAKSEGAKLRQEILNEVFDELGKVQGLKSEALREMREHFTRQVAERRLEDVVIGMAEETVAAMERYLVEQEMGKLERLAERLAPKKLPNGKLAKGKMSADAYREFVRLMGMANMTQEQRDAELERVQSEMEAAADEKRREELGERAKELVMYGALGEAGLVQARRGVAALVEFARTERARWKEAAELERARAKRLARLATEAMGGVSEQKAAEQKEAESKFAGTVGAMFKGFESVSQMWMGMEKVPALGELARRSLDTLSRGNVQLAMREQVWREKERRWMAEELGLDTEGKRNNWMARMKRVEDSKVKRAGELRRHRVRLTAEEARELVRMTKQEREQRNEQLRREAEAQGVDAENVVSDEDVALLREELAKMPEGRVQYVQTEREWRDKAGSETMKLSRDEALNILLLCEQAGYAEAADEHGFTPETLDGLRKFVGEDALKYGYFLRDALEGNGLAEVYEAREGVPFPKVENYWPGRFDQSSRVNENASALDTPAGNGTAYGMLITRVLHKLRFDLSIGATNSFRAAMAQQNNYIVMGELTSRTVCWTLWRGWARWYAVRCWSTRRTRSTGCPRG